MGQEFDRKAMERLVKGLQSKSDKIRKLRAEKYSRSEVARFLGIRPQFVRNVEVYDQRRTADQAETSAACNPANTVKVKIGSSGTVMIPRHLLDALGLKAGDTLWVNVEDGEIRMADAKAIAKRVQAMVRKFVPEGVSLVDELIAERRREAARELRGG